MSPSRPLPPPVIPGVWLPWLQTHYHVMLSGGVERFLLVHADKECDIPTVENVRQCLKVSHMHHLIADCSMSYLEICHSLSLLSHDTCLSGVVQKEISRRANDTPAILPLLKHLHTSLPPNIIGYMMSRLEETTDSPEAIVTSLQILDLYSSHRILQEQCGSRLFGSFLRLFKTTSDKISFSQQLARCLAIASERLELSDSERRGVVDTITKQIDTLSSGRGDSDSYMGAHILRYLFCCLSNVVSTGSTNIKIRWIIPWITDKDPVIRSTAFSLLFQCPDSPLTTESAVVLAVSAFADSTEIYTVRHQALSFIDRVVAMVSSSTSTMVSSTTTITVDENEQTLALCMLALKRMALYDICISFTRELTHLVMYSRDEDPFSSQMINTRYGEYTEDDNLWNSNYAGLFYILEGVLQLNVTLGKCNVVVKGRSHTELLLSLRPIFTAEMLQSVIDCDVSSLWVFTSCFCKVLVLSDSTVCDTDFLLNILKVVEVECEAEHVMELKAQCLVFIKKLAQQCELSEFWGKILPLTSKFLVLPSLQLISLQIISVALSHKNREVFSAALQNNVELSRNLSSVIFEIFSNFKITSLGDHDMVVFSVTGMLCKQVPCCRDLAVSQGILEICYEYLLLLSQHMGVLAVAAGKENVSEVRNVRNVRKKGGTVEVEDRRLLKSLSCVIYCLCCCVDESKTAAVRLSDLDIICTVHHMWSYFNHNIVVVNYVVKLLSLLLHNHPPSIKVLLSNKALFGHILDGALNSVRFSKHPFTPLRDVFFELLCVVSSCNEAVSQIWKSGFMSSFPKYQKQKCDPEKLLPWLKLLLHGTYTTFGQKMVLTVPQLLDIVLECGHKYHTLLLIRNVVFNVKCHPKLLNHGTVLDFVLSSVVFEKPRQALVALQVMLYFIKFSTKAKVILRDKGAEQTLGKLELKLRNSPSDELLTVLEPLLDTYSL